MGEEREQPSIYRLTESLRDISKTFRHIWSLLAVLMIASLLGLLGPFLSTPTGIGDIAMSVFQVSGTMVALVLPASELANNFITKFSDDLLLKITSQTQVSDETKSDLITKLSEELRANLTPAWRASIYALSSFLLSCVAMFVTAWNVTFRSVSFSWGYFLLGLSLGFLMVGAFWFFPTARYIFRLQLLNDLKRFAESLAGTSKKKPEI